MILMSDELRAWGHTATTQYTHPPRSVVMQVSLAGRMDFTEKEPPRQTLLARIMQRFELRAAWGEVFG